jgi:hypothetical protein
MGIFIRTLPNVMQHFSCSADDAQRYIDLRDEGHSSHQAALMAGLADPPEAPAGELPFELPAGAVVEGYCTDPADGLRYPYGTASDGTFWIADQFAWSAWRTREARNKVLAGRRAQAHRAPWRESAGGLDCAATGDEECMAYGACGEAGRCVRQKANPPSGTPRDAPGAWTCSRCGFRGFWPGGPHECAAVAPAVDPVQAFALERLGVPFSSVRAALQRIADMDPQGRRADDLGRAASIARAALGVRGTVPSQLDRFCTCKPGGFECESCRTNRERRQAAPGVDSPDGAQPK